jgi:hypothetical protein
MLVVWCLPPVLTTSTRGQSVHVVSSAGSGARAKADVGAVRDAGPRADSGRRSLEAVRGTDPKGDCVSVCAVSFVISCISTLLPKTVLAGTLALGSTTDLYPEKAGNRHGRS